MSKWEQINFWLKQHYLCVIGWLVVVLIASIVVLAGDNKELVGYVSFACSLSGILLAIVVIIHTWIDSADTRTVLTEVKGHLTDIRGDVGKTEGTVKQLKTDFTQVFNELLSNLESKSQTSVSELNKKKGESNGEVKEKTISGLEKELLITEEMFLMSLHLVLALISIWKEPDRTKTQTQFTKIRDKLYNAIKSKSPDSDTLTWCDLLISKYKNVFPPIKESQ
ncbi:MAG: hypothetical protein ACYSUY_07470 [Planctomycetota bacterium]|jgi:hypothetical protein